MKKLNFFLLGALIFALTFSSCNKHDDEPENQQTPVENNTSGNTDTPSGDPEVTPEKVTVTFDISGGTGTAEPQTVEKGKTATEPTTKPSKAGFKFLGWYNGDTKFDFSTTVSSEITLKAKYEYAKFTVNAEGKKVAFSSGNLQYHCKNKEWRFAPNQYDRIGDDNKNISADYDGYIDLFGWGTWLKGCNPTNNSETSSEYTWDDTKTSAIGEDWQTLTGKEWCYLFNYDGSWSTELINGENTTRASKFGKGTILLGNEVTIHGVILLPDNWEKPTDLSKEFNSNANAWDNNTYTEEEWSKMEANGAVFLPATGYRYGSVVDYVSYGGFYWSATALGAEFACDLSFYSGRAAVSSYGRYNGQSVRLVRVLQN